MRRRIHVSIDVFTVNDVGVYLGRSGVMWTHCSIRSAQRSPMTLCSSRWFSSRLTSAGWKTRLRRCKVTLVPCAGRHLSLRRFLTSFMLHDDGVLTFAVLVNAVLITNAVCPFVVDAAAATITF